MINRAIFAAAATVALLATPLVAQDAKKGGNPQGAADAKSFVEKAASGGLFEVQSSEIAKQKAKREDVRSFATTMIRDHTKANDQLKAAAQKAGQQVPQKMSKDHQAQLEKLKGANAGRFDQAYIDSQMKAHQEAVSLYQRFSRSGQDGELKSFATRTLPVLEQHQQMAKELQKASGSGATGKSSGTTGKSK
jgi:putative membrane protein